MAEHASIDASRRLSANLKRRNPRESRVAIAYEFDTEEAAYEAEAMAHDHFQQFLHQTAWFRVPWREVAAWAEASAGWRQRAS